MCIRDRPRHPHRTTSSGMTQRVSDGHVRSCPHVPQASHPGAVPLLPAARRRWLPFVSLTFGTFPEFRLLGASTLLLPGLQPVSYTHLRAHETDSYLVCRLLLEKKKKKKNKKNKCYQI